MNLFKSKKKKTRQRNNNIISKRKQASKHNIKRNKNKFNVKDLLVKIHGTPNLGLLMLTILLTIGGLLMIFSASAVIAYIYYNGDTFYFFKRQIIWVTVGVIFGYGIYLMPLTALKKLSTIMLGFGILLMIYILPEALFGAQMPLVKTLNGATRWIDLSFFDLQPSEFVKFAFIIYISAWLTKPHESTIKIKNEILDHIVNVLVPFLMLLGIISMLILAQKDLDTSAILGLTILAIYYSAGNDTLHTIGSIIIFLTSLFFGSLALIFEDYRRSRLMSFLDIFFKGQPDVNDRLGGSFQVWNGLVALGSGGLFGLGYGESKQKLFYLQEAAYTDSIFAVIGEEFGFVGALLVIIGFLYFASIGFNIARHTEDKFASLLAIGMTSWITIQAFLNIASNLSVIPFGGMPLPFFSYGGSSTITIFMAVGVLLNISKYNKNKR